MVLKFTVEQIDLVRRLKDTGITLKEIGIIFFKLDRLERTLRRGAEQQRRPSSQPYCGAGGFSAPNGVVSPTVLENDAGHQQTTPKNEEDECSSSSESSAAESPAHGQNGFQQDCAVVSDSDACHRSSSDPSQARCVALRGVQGLAFPRRHHFRFTDSQLQVLRRAFAANPYPEADERDAIANECNLSALNSGELVPTDVTSSMVNNWFCNRRKDASKLLKHSPPCTDVARLPHDALRRLTKQRERFTFVKGHLEILERHYQRNPYPNQADKERVVEECNAYSMESGSSRCGFMTITNVSNWFANRRKREFHRSVSTPDTFSPGPANYASNPTGGNGVRPLWCADLTIPSPHHHHPHHHHNGGMHHPTTIKEEPLDFDTAAGSYDREVLPDSGGLPWHSAADLESAVAAHVAATPFEPVGVGPMGMGQERPPPMHHAMDSGSPVTTSLEGPVMPPHQQPHQQAHQPHQQQPPGLHQPVKQEGSDPWPLANGILAQAWR